RWQGRHTGSFCRPSLLTRQLSQTEIKNLGLAAADHENVCRLDASMNNASRVCGVQSVRNLDRYLKQPFRLKWLSFDIVPEGLAVQQLHGDERVAFMFIDIVNRANIG